MSVRPTSSDVESYKDDLVSLKKASERATQVRIALILTSVCIEFEKIQIL